MVRNGLQLSCLLGLLLALGCEPAPIDADIDLFSPPEDCNDEDPSVFPGAGELCNGIDDDCDGAIDENYDEDRDGYLACGAIFDCDDDDPTVFPGATEICDGRDNDCNSLVDDGPDADGDGDGYCSDLDCDDGDAEVNPDATESCDGVDEDCNGVVDDGFDQDGDGFSPCGQDCDDEAAAVFPGAAEVCNGVDDDCDGETDEDFDLDGDGVTSCADPPDCDDADGSAWPGAPEQCDSVDNDCDGTVDEDVGIDLDLDGYTACEGDCDDTDRWVSPGSSELPGGVDEDCDGQLDEGYEGTVPLAAIRPSSDGTSQQELLGQVLAAGDFDGDGLTDVVAGMPLWNNERGKVAVWFGRSWSPGAAPPSIDPDFSVSSADEGAYFGRAVDLGDVNGDGVDDLIVGEPQENWPTAPLGRVRVWFGGSRLAGDLVSETDDVTLDGEFGTEQCGRDVAALGDVNGDGLGDLGFTCPWYQSGASGGFKGRAVVLFGRGDWAGVSGAADADGSLVGDDGAGDDGMSVLGVDLDADGTNDVVVGFPAMNGGGGQLALRLGGGGWAPGLAATAQDVVWNGTANAFEKVGSWLGAGDVDGDGDDDLLFGQKLDAGFGTAGVLLAGAVTGGLIWDSAASWLQGDVADGELGSAAAVADLDGDGLPEWHVGFPGAAGVAGQAVGSVLSFEDPVSRFSGEHGPADADWRFEGAAQGDFAGEAVVACPDFNGDGRPDLAVSAPHTGSDDAGRLYIVSGF